MKKLRLKFALVGIVLSISISAFGQNTTNLEQKHFVESIISLIQANYMNPFNANLEQLYAQLRQAQIDCVDCTQGKLENKLAKVIDKINDFHLRIIPGEWNEDDDFGPIGSLSFYGGRYGFYVVALNNTLVVAHVHAGTSAGSVGVTKGDVILTVNGFKGSAEQLKKKIRQSEVYYRSIEIKMMTIDGKEKTVQMIAGANDGAFSSQMLQPDTALITMTHFDYGVADKWFHKTLSDLKAKGMKKLIIDVRYSNGGGPFAVVNMAGAFLLKAGQRYLDKAGVKINYQYENGMTYYEKDDAGTVTKEIEPFINPASFDGPIVVLISDFSVSAAEEFADMLQAAKRATLVGDATAGGSGVLANGFNLIGGTFFVITTHRIFDLENRPMNLVATPDISLPLDGNLLKLGRDNQIERAIEVLNSK